jgi:hypothetical protein
MAVLRACLIAALVAGGCGVAPTFGTPAAEFTSWLEGYGQKFTPELAPPGTADWHSGIVGFPFPDAQVESAIFGDVTCVDPSPEKDCAHRGLARPGESVPIWIVTFRDAPANQGCSIPWAVLDAHTGEFVVGNGPPCR